MDVNKRCISDLLRWPRALWLALLVQGLVALIALGMVPGAHHLAFIRTLTLCAAALALAFGGRAGGGGVDAARLCRASRWSR